MKPRGILIIIFVMLFASWRCPAGVRDVDTQPVTDPALDLTDAGLERLGDGQIALIVQCASRPGADRLRFLLDTDGPGQGEPTTGADFMMEGGAFYRYPEHGKGWEWDSMEPPVFIRAGRSLICVLPDLPPFEKGRWRLETLTPTLVIVDRLPETGMMEFKYAELPLRPWQTQLQSEDISTLLAHEPQSLSFRLDAELKNMRWKPQVTPLTWQPNFMTSALPLRVSVEDAVTGERESFNPVSSFIYSNAVLWTGCLLGVEAQLVVEPDTNGNWRLTGLWQSEASRCIRIGIGCDMELDGWIWHDDIYTRRPVLKDLCQDTVPIAYGKKTQSEIPFGVISSEKGLLEMETALDEPRVMRIFADGKRGFFGIEYDLALTSGTSNFPGRGTFRCMLKSKPSPGDFAFRSVLNDFISRDEMKPEWVFDGSVMACSTPWLYEIALPPSSDSSAQKIERPVRLYALGEDARAESACAAWLGGIRRMDGSRNWVVSNLRGTTTAHLQLDLDPELATTTELPLNPVMVEWRNIRRLLDEGAENVCLDLGMPAKDLDFNPSALAVADYPCSFKSGEDQPGVMPVSSAYELTVALSGALHDMKKRLVIQAPAPFLPFFIPYADGLIFAVRPADLTEQNMNRWRAAAGQKPCKLQMDPSGVPLDESGLRSYFDKCLAWAFFPGVDNSGLGATYIPLIRRLSEAGWEPAGSIRSSDADVRLEQFGNPTPSIAHVTLRNMTKSDKDFEILLPPSAEPRLILNPLNSACRIVASNETACPWVMPRFAVATLDVIPLSALDQELAFLHSWHPPGNDAESCIRTLESMREEIKIGGFAHVEYSEPAVHGETNEITIVILNKANRPIQVENAKIISRRHFREVKIVPLELAPGQRGQAVGSFDDTEVSDSPWLEIQWELGNDKTNRLCTRMIKPSWVDPVEVTPLSSNLMTSGRTADLKFRVRNNSRLNQELAFQWQGDFKGGRRSVALVPFDETTVQLPVSSARALKGQMFTEVRRGKTLLLQKWFDVEFK